MHFFYKSHAIQLVSMNALPPQLSHLAGAVLCFCEGFSY